MFSADTSVDDANSARIFDSTAVDSDLFRPSTEVPGVRSQNNYEKLRKLESVVTPNFKVLSIV